MQNVTLNIEYGSVHTGHLIRDCCVSSNHPKQLMTNDMHGV